MQILFSLRGFLQVPEKSRYNLGKQFHLVNDANYI